MKKVAVAIAVVAIVVVAGLSMLGMSNQTTAIENSISHSASSFKEMTTGTYLSHYNKIKEELVVSDVKVTIEGTSTQIKVMVDPVKLEAPKKL